MSETSTRVRLSPYLRILEDIELQITRGDLSPGDVLPTRSELARHYQTARATVDKAFGELVRRGLVESGSGRRTIVVDKSHPQRHAKTICVLWNWTEEQEKQGGDYLDALFRGIREACAEYLLEVHFRSAPFQSWREIVHGKAAQGLLIVRPEFTDSPIIDAIHSSGVPVIQVPSALDECLAPSVAADNAGGIAAAIDHLCALGHREIGFVGLTATVPDHFERLVAFLDETGKRGVDVRPEWIRIAHENKPSRFRNHLSDWLGKERHPSAVISSDFLMTLSLLGRLNDLGLSVPGDISVVTYDDVAAAAQLHPSLTAVSQPISRLGYLSVQRLLERIAGEDVPHTDRLMTQVIVRESTGPVNGNRKEDGHRTTRATS